MSWVDDFNRTVGSVTEAISTGAATYDRITSGRESPVPTGGVTEPPKTTGVDTTQGTTAPAVVKSDNSLLLLVGLAGLAAIVLFAKR